jgi:hypothetical protein
MLTTPSLVFNTEISVLMFFFEIQHITILKEIGDVLLKH